MSINKPVLVAVDDGFDWIKVVTDGRQEIFPTSVSFSPRRGIQLIDGGRTLDERHYDIEGTLYAVGADVRDPIETRFDDFKFSAQNFALAIDAIRRILPPGTAVHAITGMPLDRYYMSSGATRETLPIRKRKAWTREIRDPRGAPLSYFVDVTPMSESVAGWFDYVITPDLQPDEDRINEHTTVIDIGGRTTDVATFEDRIFNPRRSGTLERGILDLAEAVMRVAKDRLPGVPRLPHELIRSAIDDGVVQIDGYRIDVGDEVHRERRQLVRHIVTYVMSLQRRTTSAKQRLLFIGGGSIALEADLREHFPHAVLAPHPELANARGMWKFGRLKEQAAMGGSGGAGAPKGPATSQAASTFSR